MEDLPGPRRVVVNAIGRSPRTGARIAGLGAYRPGRVVGNDEAAAAAGVDAEWIEQRVGVRERRYAAAEETVVSMAVEAGRSALHDAAVTAAEVDTVILASSSMPSPMPNGAAQVAAALGCRAAGFDLNAACSGFNHALAVADALVRAGAAGGVLVVAAERMTDWVAPADRDTGPIFADGAAAALVLPSSEPGIFPVAWGSDGAKADLIVIPPATGRMEIAGRKVFRWAANALAPVVDAACELARIKPRDLKAFVPHQANLRIVDALARSLDAPELAIAKDIVGSGNTCAASVPLALHALRRSGEITSGDPVLLFGFGAGLTYAAQVVRCP
ncbi:beta-ketoacyl-ACP synthase 3 [Streptomyces lavendulae]|uniref:beta-ketoacyl-ACP synthase 3 n=1 Tax=Streptomyces lavendulae TaxID=1914 RepID=UPI0025547E4C|nr:beta-ketoacyl-ACP synthase 3 [Streptomyces lavendulae]